MDNKISIPLVILTKSPEFSLKDFSRGAKRLVKNVLGQKRGPSAVTESLISGLKEVGVDFLYNPPHRTIPTSSCVYVNENVDALAWAIKAKRQGLITKLVAGPAIVNVPSEAGGIITNDAIDTFLSASPWNIKWLISLDQRMERSLRLWPAGVKDYGALRNTSGGVLLYNKNPNPKLLEHICSYFELHKIPYTIVKYGHYAHESFISLMKHSKIAVFLSHSESQGLALHEMWMADIPTLVWNPGFVEYKDLRWEDEKLSAPYMSDECGTFFKGVQDFDIGFEEMMKQYDTYTPRLYSLKDFTNKRAAERFLEIINTP